MQFGADYKSLFDQNKKVVRHFDAKTLLIKQTSTPQEEIGEFERKFEL
jgi:hypothetical protein